jgi:hypothetical protein
MSGKTLYKPVIARSPQGDAAISSVVGVLRDEIASLRSQ